MVEFFRIMIYKEIFNKRGNMYHEAMIRMPYAREEEFTIPLSLIEPKPGTYMLDVPSGGCYLHKYYRARLNNVRLVSLEVSVEFAKFCSSSAFPVLTDSLDCMPFKNASFHLVFSLAGVHHIEDRMHFYQEVYRVLKKDGVFLLGDVLEGTPVASFLNDFVDRYNSMGHKGHFLSQKDVGQIMDKGFLVLFSDLKKYYWKFHSLEEMVYFCKTLFGLDRGDEKDIIRGIHDYLGFLEEGGFVKLNWHLFFIKAVKLS